MSSPSPAERFARASARSTHPHTADFAEMQRFELDEARAFEFLVRVSNSGNIKLRDVAQQVVDELNAQAHAKD